MSSEIKIKNIITYGLLSAEELAQISPSIPANERSFDRTDRNVVAINAISSLAGIQISLSHKAKGGISEAIEENILQPGLLSSFLQKYHSIVTNKQKTLLQQMPGIPEKFILSAARKNVILENREFLEELSLRAHHTALIILNIESQEGENTALDGCKETFRKKVSPENIQHVLISNKFRQKFNALEKVLFVPEENSHIYFSYLDENGDPHSIPIPEVSIPNYQSFLLKYARDRNLKDQPLYTHMTRLPLHEED